MPEQSNYWTRKTVTRRAALRGAALAGGGLAAFGLAACGGKKTTTGSSGAASNATAARTALDPTKGKRGGTIVIQQYGDPGGGLELIKARNAGVHQLAGFTHDGLLEFRNGTPAVDGYSIQTQPCLAQAMPEQPDPQTYVYKLRPAKFHNGRAVNSEDVKWSYETYAFAPESAWKTDWSWLDHVETPDAQTAVVKTKFPYADALQSMAQRNANEVLCREHQESPDAEKKLLGSGAFLFVDYQPPVATHYKRNPEYHTSPYPYFDAIEFLGTSDPSKKVADFIAHKVHMTYWFPPEEREQVKKGRPDAQLWTYLTSAYGNVFMRTDKPPFNDARVRQALSMALDRKALSQAITNGEGVPDQVMSQAGKYWGFRKPSELGAAAKYWNYDPQAAKQLLSAAGVSLPIKTDVPHWNATVVGQKQVDAINLIEAQWRNLGLVDAKDVELTFGQSTSTIQIGNYDLMMWFPHTIPYVPDMGIQLRNEFYWPPDGIKGPPTLNLGYINDPKLNDLVVKQVGQFDKDERIQTLRELEQLLADQMYRIATTTANTNWFGDPSVKNMQTPRDAYNGAIPYVKYWWFA